METVAREFDLYENKINDRRKRIYTDMNQNQMYVGQFL